MRVEPDTPCKTLHIGNHDIKVGHPERIYFPDHGYSKFQTLGYYASVSALMAQYSKARALVLKRYPEGINTRGFFQKRVGKYFPDWIAQATLPTKDGTLTYALGGNPAAFVWLANLGTIEFHTMLSRADKPNAPDQVIFDLDPPKDYVDDVRLAALGLKAICDDLGLASFVKSTGSRGFHVIVPIARYYDFDQTRSFAKLLAARLMAEQPGKLSLNLKKASRDGHILIDVWRNGYAQTAVAPYSVRARPGAPIALPLHWNDLQSPKVHPRQITIANFARQKEQVRIAWPKKIDPPQRLEKAWKILKS